MVMGLVRRRSAVFVADAVGFTTYAEADESAALAHLLEALSVVFDPLITAAKGRVFKRTGDGLMAEFTDPNDAVSCAHAIQTQLPIHRTVHAKASSLRFRIGINFDDVWADAEDLLGDGVNVAARLQTVAPPGGIAMSASVFQAATQHTDLVVEDHGPLRLKGIQRLVHTYIMRLGPKPPTLAIGGPVARNEVSIAVLPFDSFGQDNDVLSDGLTEDIITDLAKVPGFLVIARNSTFAFKGHAKDLRHVAQELGVRYILEGSVRVAGNRMRVNAQLIDAPNSAKHIWADRFDKNIEDIFEVQDLIAAEVVNALTRQLGNLVPSSNNKHPANFKAYEYCLRARNLFAQSSEANAEALDLLQRALALQPDYAEAHWQLAMVRAFEWLQWGKPQQPARQLALAAAQQAVQLDPQDSNAHWVLGYVLLNEKRWDEAEPHYRKAVELNPNNADALAPFCNFLVLTGRPDEAVPLAIRALKVSPFPPAWYYWALGFAQTACGRYDDAIATLRRPETYRTVTRRILAAALALSGNQQEAAEEARYFMEAHPGWRISTWLATQPFASDQDRQFWKSAYMLAGFPE